MHTRIIVGRLEFLTKKNFKIYLNSLIQREKKNLKKVFCCKKLFTIEGGWADKYTPLEKVTKFLKKIIWTVFFFYQEEGVYCWNKGNPKKGGWRSSLGQESEEITRWEFFDRVIVLKKKKLTSTGNSCVG